MSFLDWLLEKRPGLVTRLPDRVQIVHSDDDRSTLWYRTVEDPHAFHGDLAEFYEEFDGADLFSSTFKIASIREGKNRGGVDITFTLKEIQTRFNEYDVLLPEKASAFMYKAGVGIYSASHTSSRIFLYDNDFEEIEEYTSLTSIVEEWIEATGDD